MSDWWLAYNDTRDLRDPFGPYGRIQNSKSFAPAARAAWLGNPPIITSDGTNISFTQYQVGPQGLYISTALTRPLIPSDCARYGATKGYVTQITNVPDDLGEPAGRQPWGP